MGLDTPADVYTIPLRRQDDPRALAAKQAGGAVMLKDITIGQHFPGHSVLHRCDPG